MKLSDIHVNPKNPRIIKDDRFKKLVRSIQEFPAMMELRPIVVDSAGMILGGNMRFKAIKELGMKEIPDSWIKVADKLTEEEKERFVVEDNVQFGDWDETILIDNYDLEELQNWGVDIIIPFNGNVDDFLVPDIKEKKIHTATCPKCGKTFEI